MRYLKFTFVLASLTLIVSCRDDEKPKIEDVQSPGILQMMPANNAQDVPLDAIVEITFDEPLDQSSIANSLALSNSGDAIAGDLLYTPAMLKLSFMPSKVLDFNTRYTVALSSSLKDTADNALEAVSWSFITVPETGAARYRLTFDATWSSESHPTDFPSNAHFSGLIGMTHSIDTSLFYINTPASLGIKNMAETGAKTNLTTEIQQIIDSGKGEFIISGDGIGLSPDEVSVEFNISISYPRVSITTMIAPSPDWFVATHNLNLYKDGKWIEELTTEVKSYDAGTDSGITFLSANEVTSPVANIISLVDPPLGVNGVVAPVGTMRFTRID